MSPNSGASDFILELQQVSKTFRQDLFKPAQKAVSDLSCGFRRGACTGLLGHNGAGKTTSIRLILGLLRPDSGTILLNGQTLQTSSRRQIGYMPEVSKLAAALTVEEALSHQLQLYATGLSRSARREAMEHTLTRVGLSKHRRKAIKHLSKGMARRLAWAQAVVHQPRLLILDEPASGLDPLGRQEMLAWVREERQRGTSIILCTHDLTDLSNLCDDFHILRDGQLVFSTISVIRALAENVRLAPYHLQISGADESHLRRIAAKRQLPPWHTLTRNGFAHTMSFFEYAPASAWIDAVNKEGLVILRFGDSAYAAEDQLMTYFVRA